MYHLPVVVATSTRKAGLVASKDRAEGELNLDPENSACRKSTEDYV